MMRSSVVLPQPDGPRKQTSSPASIVEVDRLQRHEAAERLVDAASAERWQRWSGSRSAPCSRRVMRRDATSAQPWTRSASSTRRGSCRGSSPPTAKSFFASTLRVIRRHVRQRLRQRRHRDDREVLRVQRHRGVGRPPSRSASARRPCSSCPCRCRSPRGPSPGLPSGTRGRSACPAPFRGSRGTRTRCRRRTRRWRPARTGREPECMYCAMFSCRPSMNFQPSASP